MDRRRKIEPVLFVALCLCLLVVPVSAEERVYVVNSYVHQVSPVNFSTVVMARGSDLEILGTSQNLGDNAHSIAVDPDQDELWVTVPDSNQIVILDARDLSVKHLLKLKGLLEPMGIAFRPENKYEVYITGHGSENVVIVNRINHSVLGTVEVGGLPYAVAFYPDGSKAYILDCQNNNLDVIRTSDRDIINKLTWDGGGNSLQEMVINSTRLYITNWYAGQIEVIRNIDDIKLSPISTPLPRALGISPSSNYLFIGHCTGTPDAFVAMMRLADQTVVSEANISNCARRMAVRSNGTRIFVVDHNSDELFAYDVSGESLTFEGATDLNTVPGYSGASPVGIGILNATIIPYFCVFRPSSWNNWIFSRDLATVEYRDHYGISTDIPLVGDFNNGGIVDRAVFRSGEWKIDYEIDGDVDASDHYGMAGDLPVAGYLNSDRVTDRAVFRGSAGNNWIIDFDMDGTVDVRDHFGSEGDIPLVGDFNNDWIPDRAVFRGSAWNNWIIDYGMNGTVDVRDHFGSEGDIPLAGRINTDLFMDRAVFRDGEWIIDYNMDGSVDWRQRYGSAGDEPLTWWDL